MIKRKKTIINPFNFIGFEGINYFHNPEIGSSNLPVATKTNP